MSALTAWLDMSSRGPSCFSPGAAAPFAPFAFLPFLAGSALPDSDFFLPDFFSGSLTSEEAAEATTAAAVLVSVSVTDCVFNFLAFVSVLLEAARLEPDALVADGFVDLDLAAGRLASAEVLDEFFTADLVRRDTGFFALLEDVDLAVLARLPDAAVVFFATVVDFVVDVFDAAPEVRVEEDLDVLAAVFAVDRLLLDLAAAGFRVVVVRADVFFAFAVVALPALPRVVAAEGFFAFLAAAVDFVVFCLAVVVAIFHSEWCR